jgi:hypothetical protein
MSARTGYGIIAGLIVLVVAMAASMLLAAALT